MKNTLTPPPVKFCFINFTFSISYDFFPSNLTRRYTRALAHAPPPAPLARAPRVHRCRPFPPRPLPYGPIAVGRDVPIAPPRLSAVRGLTSRSRRLAHARAPLAALPPAVAHRSPVAARHRPRWLTARLWRLATPQWLTAQRFPFLFHRIFNTIRRTCFHPREVSHASFCRFVQRRLRQRSSYI